MRCPRCGREAEGMARACPHCGFILPFSLRQLRQMPGPVGPAAEARLRTGPWTGPPWDSGAATGETPLPAPQEWAWSALDTGPDPGASSAPRSLDGLPRLHSLDIPDPRSAAMLPAPHAFGTVEMPAPSANLFSATGAPPSDDGLSLDARLPYGAAPLPGSTMVMAALNAGTLLKGGRYRLLQRFSAATATGRRGEADPPLYLASDAEQPSVRVLVQELPLQDLAPKLADQLHRRAATRLELAGQHAGVPALLESFSERQRRFLVIELPAGERLGDRLRTVGALSEAEVTSIGMQVLEVLTRLNGVSPPIMHGSISPDNIILQPGGRVALIGFAPSLLLRGNGWDQPSVAGGARGYAAPEQQRGHADVRTDLYSLAAVLYYAITGQDPAERTGVLFDPVRRINSAVSPQLDAVLSQALRPAPAQRYQSVDDMRQALALAAARGVASGPLAAGDASHKPAAAPRSRPAMLPGAAGALRAQMGRPIARPRGWEALWAAMAILVLLGLVGSASLYLIRGRSAARPPAEHGTPFDPTAVALYRQKDIGVSGGELIFDGGRPDGALKRQAAQALVGHNVGAALSAFRQAMAADRTDAEAAIYAADAAIAQGHDPVVTVVAGVAFGANDAAAESALQGIYLAQERINSLALLPGTTQLRVLIANSGPTPDDATTVARLIAGRAAGGNPLHIVGVVGWPEEAQTRLVVAALAGLAGEGLPIVAPGRADAGITSAAYFALAPTEAQEGSALADGAVTLLNSRRVLVLSDPADARSATVALAFVTQARQQYPGRLAISRQEAFVTGHITQLTQVARDAIVDGDDTIFVSGGDDSTAYMAQAVAQLARRYGMHIHVLASTQANTPALLGVGSSQTAGIVRGQPTAMTAVAVASLAATGEWSAVGVPEGVQPTFDVDYTSQFGPAAAPGGLGEPDATAILAYDAVRLVGRAATSAARGAALPTPAAVVAALAAVGPGKPFQGVGGAIAFHGAGGPLKRAMALLALAPSNGTPAPGQPVLSATVMGVIGGITAFCGGPTCPTV
jgi:Protein kinase domain